MSRLGTLFCLWLGSGIGAIVGLNSWETTSACVWFSALALFCHWVLSE